MKENIVDCIGTTSSDTLNVWKEEEDGIYSLCDDLIQEEIRKHAYHKWEEFGKPENQDLDFWLSSEKEIHELIGL